MPNYFNAFPKIYYDAEGAGNFKLVTNLLRRVQMKKGLKASYDFYANIESNRMLEIKKLNREVN